MIVLVLELLVEEHDVHATMQCRYNDHHQDLGHMGQLRDDRCRNQNEHGKAAEIGGEQAGVCGQNQDLGICTGRAVQSGRFNC